MAQEADRWDFRRGIKPISPTPKRKRLRCGARYVALANKKKAA